MPTNNPKVSAYIPQHIFDCLKAFYEERSISMSQAVAIIFAEYFGVNYQVDQVFLGGVIPAQIHSLEQTLSNFIESADRRFQELEAIVKSFELSSNPLLDQDELPIQFTSSQSGESLDEIIDSSKNEINVLIPKIIQDKQYEITLPSELLSEPLIEDISGSGQIGWQSANSVLLGELHSGLPHKKPDQELSDELKVNENELIPSIQPLSGIQLGKRLNVHHSAVTRYKSGKRKQSLTEWSKSVDPDGVAWEYSEEQKKYIPLSQGKPNTGLQGELLKVDSDDLN